MLGLIQGQDNVTLLWCGPSLLSLRFSVLNKASLTRLLPHLTRGHLVTCHNPHTKVYATQTFAVCAQPPTVAATCSLGATRHLRTQLYVPPRSPSINLGEGLGASPKGKRNDPNVSNLQSLDPNSVPQVENGNGSSNVQHYKILLKEDKAAHQARRQTVEFWPHRHDDCILLNNVFKPHDCYT